MQVCPYACMTFPDGFPVYLIDYPNELSSNYYLAFWQDRETVQIRL